jgi:hypothetical protein
MNDGNGTRSKRSDADRYARVRPHIDVWRELPGPPRFGCEPLPAEGDEGDHPEFGGRGAKSGDIGGVQRLHDTHSRLSTAMAGTARQMPYKAWAAERDVNVLCLDRVRFDSVPVTVGQGDLRRMPTSSQMAWEARRKHAPCSVPIPPA